MNLFYLILIVYILLLIPLANLCNKRTTGGVLVLVLGIFFTPIVGYMAFLLLKDNSSATSS